MYKIESISPFSKVKCKYCHADIMPKGMYKISFADDIENDVFLRVMSTSDPKLAAQIFNPIFESIIPEVVCHVCCDLKTGTRISSAQTMVLGRQPYFHTVDDDEIASIRAEWGHYKSFCWSKETEPRETEGLKNIRKAEARVEKEPEENCLNKKQKMVDSSEIPDESSITDNDFKITKKDLIQP